MTKVGIYLGTKEDPTYNVEKQIHSWGDYLSPYFELDAFGSAEFPKSASKYYNVYRTRSRKPSNPFSKIIGVYQDCTEYITDRDPDILIQLWKYPSHGTGLALAGTRHKIPTITRFSGDAFNGYKNERGIRKVGSYVFANILARIPLYTSNKFIALGPYGRSELVNNGVDPDDILILPPALDVTGRFVPTDAKDKYREQFGLSTESNIALYVGRLTGAKGMDFLSTVIQKVGQNSGWRFVLVGEGPFRKYFETEFGDWVKTVGEIEYSEVDAFYKASDLYVHPSGHEMVPLVILEALSCDLPVVARKAGDVSFVTPNTVETPEEMATMILSEDWVKEWKNREYFGREYQQQQLVELIRSPRRSQ